jgi:hypothetical protein
MALKRCDYNPEAICTDCQLCQTETDGDVVS